MFRATRAVTFNLGWPQRAQNRTFPGHEYNTEQASAKAPIEGGLGLHVPLLQLIRDATLRAQEQLPQGNHIANSPSSTPISATAAAILTRGQITCIGQCQLCKTLFVFGHTRFPIIITWQRNTHLEGVCQRRGNNQQERWLFCLKVFQPWAIALQDLLIW